MELKERLKICSKCKNRSFDMSKGMVCSLTGEKPNFTDQCPDFVKDEEVNDQPLVENPEALEAEQLIEMIDQNVLERLRMEQNLPLGIIGGVVAGLLGAILWGFISVATQYQIGFMAIGVGFGVGFAVRFLGRGIEKVFGIVAAVIALFSCLLGNFFTIVGFIAKEIELGFWETLKIIDYGYIPELMFSTFDFMDILFYGLALGAGYKYAFRKITEEKLNDLSIG